MAVSQQLAARNISNTVLEKGDHAGWMWSQVYDSLRLHTGKHLSSLPGMPFSARTSLFPTRSEFAQYLSDYTDRFQLPIRAETEVTGLSRQDGIWTIETTSGLFRSRSVVVATGIMSSPVIPGFKGLSSFTGLVFHSNKYKRPNELMGRSILVVGIGNSAAEIASELAGAGLEVAVSVRSGANVIPRSIAGVPAQYLGWAMGWLPGKIQRRIARGTGLIGSLLKRKPTALPRKPAFSKCMDVPVIGASILDHINAGRVRIVPGVAEFRGKGAYLTDGTEWDGDSVILATGYRGATEWMGCYDARDECGLADRRDRVRSASHPDLYFVGHNYDGRGGLYNIRVDAKRIGRLISRRHAQW